MQFTTNRFRFTAALGGATAMLMLGASAAAAHGNSVATASIALADGTSAGTARIVRHHGHLRLEVSATGIEPGQHGVHIHTIGKCEAPGFTTAGGHLNPQGHQHGTMNAAGPHMGDLPNLVVGANRKGKLSIDLAGDSASLAAALLDADGSAIVIHAAADDYRTDPSGNSGSRIACGVLQAGH